MTLEEAVKLADIAARVDNGCSVCVGEVVSQLNEAFPNFVFVMDEDSPTVLVSVHENVISQ